MHKSPYEGLMALVRFDQETNSLRFQLAALYEERDNVVKIRKDSGLQQEKLNEQWLALRKIVDACELDMKILEQQRVSTIKRMEAAVSPREHQALRKEIDAIRYKQNDLEQDLVNAWGMAESAKKAADTKSKGFEHERRLLDDKIMGLEQEIAALVARIDDREKRWLLESQGLPEDLLSKYTMMRTTVSDPVVVVEQGQCGACFHSLTRHELSLLSKSELLQCKGCYRFLYLPSSH